MNWFHLVRARTRQRVRIQPAATASASRAPASGERNCYGYPVMALSSHPPEGFLPASSSPGSRYNSNG